MPLFSHSSGVQITEGNFYEIARDMNTCMNPFEGLHLLHRASANDASHDSAERYPQPRCHPETRTTQSRDQNLWLHGPAGAGKSAIAQSFCQELKAKGCLGGSFFFKRGNSSRGNGNKLFSTLAYQLAILLPELQRIISERVESDPSIVDKSLSAQLHELIIKPVGDTTRSRNFVIIIDGLDECEGRDVQQEILRSIGNALNQSPPIPLRILIASRPEPHIVEVFQEQFLVNFHWPLNIQQSFDDVRLYLRDEFARIHQQHHETMASVVSPWPSWRILNNLVDKSSGYFIYASTVIKFIDDKDFRPTERLEIVMGITESDFGSPFSALDKLYIEILAAVPARPQLPRILSVIAAKLNLTTRHIDQLLGLNSGDVRLTLRGLHSVINVPPESTTISSKTQQDQVYSMLAMFTAII
ncbi:hypothetical protein B0H13DRAFT_2465291 [Mycena leptocephala]|nr:hypothetical protein B0H13DRAFT_2465291 [Mycena leptocephala]